MIREFLLQEKNEDFSSLFCECLNIDLLFLFPQIHPSHSFYDILGNFLSGMVKYTVLLNVLKPQWVLAGIELIIFLVAGMVLRFGFRMRVMLVTR